MTAWATPYVIVPKLDEAALREQSELSNLWAGLSGSGPLSAEQQDRLFQVTASLRRSHRQMSGASLAFMKMASGVGITLSRQQRHKILGEARSKYGGCVSEPSIDSLNMTSQLPNKMFRE